jgi:hypothetical protein
MQQQRHAGGVSNGGAEQRRKPILRDHGQWPAACGAVEERLCPRHLLEDRLLVRELLVANADHYGEG